MQSISYMLSGSKDHRSYEERRQAILSTVHRIDRLAWTEATSLVEMRSSLQIAVLHDRIRSEAGLLDDDFLYAKDDQAKQICLSGRPQDRVGIEILAALEGYTIVKSNAAVAAALLARAAVVPLPTLPISSPLRSLGIGAAAPPNDFSSMLKGLGTRGR